LNWNSVEKNGEKREILRMNDAKVGCVVVPAVFGRAEHKKWRRRLKKVVRIFGG